MYYEIYADSLFFLQFVLNLYVLEAVNHMYYHGASGKRIVLGAMLGAVAYILPFWLPVKLMYGMLLGFCLSMLGMSWFTFQVAGWRQFSGVLEKMLLTTLLMGSLLIFVLKMLPPGQESCLGVIGILLLGAICYGVVCRLTGKREEEKPLCKVYLQEDSVCLEVNALLDTGNSLTEPISGKPVAVLAESVFQRLYSGKEPQGYRVIPYRSVGKQKGILPGYLLGHIIIEYQGVKKECKGVYVAISEALLSQAGDCQMILNPRVLKE